MILGSLLIIGCGQRQDETLAPWQASKLTVIVPSKQAGDESRLEQELAGLFAQELSRPIKFVELPPNQVIPTLQGHKAHFAAFGLNRSSTPPLLTGPVYRTTQLQALCGASMPQDLEQLAQLQLAVVSGSVEESALLALQKKQPSLKWESLPNMTAQELLNMVAAGQVGCTIASANLIKKLVLLHPGLEPSFDLAPNVRQVWALPEDGDPELMDRMEAFFSRIKHDGTLRNLLDRYFGDPVRGLESQEAADFIHSISTELPRYRKLFEEAGRISGIDWRLIASIAFHESKWDPLATSPTNVRGMMMLTEDTAERMGVKDRLNPKQSIRAGANYLKLLMERLPPSIAEPDRIWFALAAYNQGAAHLEDARILTQRHGLNPNCWVDVKSVLPLLAQPEQFEKLKFGHARGGEAVFMVEQIRDYTEILRSLTPEASSHDDAHSFLHDYFHPWERAPGSAGIL